MSRRSEPTRPGLRRGFRHPVRSDRAFWVALALAAVAVVIEFALSSPDTALGWFAFALIAVAVTVLIVTLVGIAVGTVRGFTDGWRSAHRGKDAGAAGKAAPGPSDRSGDDPASDATGPRPDPDPDPEPVAMSDTAKRLAAAAGSLGSSVRKPTSADVDRTARALGRAASAAKRAYQKDE